MVSLVVSLSALLLGLSGTFLSEDPNLIPGRTARSISFFDNGDRLAIVDGTRYLTIWSSRSLQRLWTIDSGDDDDRFLCACSNGDVLIAGSEAGVVRAWDLSKRRRVWFQRALSDPDHRAEDVTGVALSASGRYLATASAGGTIRVWNLSSSTLKEKSTAIDSVVEQVLFADKDHSILCSGFDAAWTYQLGRGSEGLRKLDRASIQSIDRASFVSGPTGTPFVICGSQGCVRRLSGDHRAGEILVRDGSGARYYTGSLSGDARFLAISTYDAHLHIWDIRSRLKTIDLPCKSVFASAFVPGRNSLYFLEDGVLKVLHIGKR